MVLLVKKHPQLVAPFTTSQAKKSGGQPQTDRGNAILKAPIELPLETPSTANESQGTGSPTKMLIGIWSCFGKDVNLYQLFWVCSFCFGNMILANTANGSLWLWSCFPWKRINTLKHQTPQNTWEFVLEGPTRHEQLVADSEMQKENATASLNLPRNSGGTIHHLNPCGWWWWWWWW